MELDCPAIAVEASPGRFVQVRIGTGTDPFLRRTFSIAGADPDAGMLRLLVDVVGRGTGLLCTMQAGGTVSLIGPLGVGFEYDDIDGTALLIGGGSGAAPLAFLAHRLMKEGRPVRGLFGGASAEYGPAVEGFLPPELDWELATDDGSAGFHGPVTGLLERALAAVCPGAVYACGPKPMMAAVAALTAGTGVPCRVSLEENMACGMGVCLGCAVALRDGRMVRSCVDGPVFDAAEVAW